MNDIKFDTFFYVQVRNTFVLWRIIPQVQHNKSCLGFCLQMVTKGLLVP